MLAIEDAKLLRALVKHFDRSDRGCYLWAGPKDKDGYGNVFANGARIRAHRAAAHLFLGMALDSEMLVCHHCDVRNCWNPDHIYIGTVQQNNQDTVERGRAVGAGKGSRHHAATTDEATVFQIKQRIRSGARQVDIAKEFGISHKKVNAIKVGRTWTHVPWPDEEAA